MVHYINGKFLAQRMTGVQRVASRLVVALDRVADIEAVLLVPPAASPLPLRSIRVRAVGSRGIPLHLWEQCTFPRAASDGVTVNLAGAAPAIGERKVCLIHDAAVFDTPLAYSRTFVAWYRWLFRHLSTQGARILTCSSFSRARLALALSLEPGQIGIVPNGADHLDAVEPDRSVLREHGLVGRPFVLAVGSANPNKNLVRLKDAYAQAGVGPEVALVLAGGRDPRVFSEVPSFREQAGIVMVGEVSDAALKALYGAALGLIFPSTYEGFGLPPLEAMSCGCPVVAARAAAIPDVCGKAALYVEPESTGSIAMAIRQIVAEEALRARLRQAGWQRARQYRWDESARALAGHLAAA